MVVEGKVTDGKQLYMRTEIASGEIGGQPYCISMNIDGMVVFVEFKNCWVLYHTVDMLKDAYEMAWKRGDIGEELGVKMAPRPSEPEPQTPEPKRKK